MPQIRPVKDVYPTTLMVIQAKLLGDRLDYQTVYLKKDGRLRIAVPACSAKKIFAPNGSFRGIGQAKCGNVHVHVDEGVSYFELVKPKKRDCLELLYMMPGNGPDGRKVSIWNKLHCDQLKRFLTRKVTFTNGAPIVVSLK